MNAVTLVANTIGGTLLVALTLGLVSVATATSTATSTETVEEEVAVVETAAAVVTPLVPIEQIPGENLQMGDFVVGPGRVEVVVRPGETVTREVMVTNRLDDDRRFELTVEDMSGSADGAQAAVLLGDQDGPYSLKDYVSFPTQVIDLDLGQRARVPVTITMPPNAEPGGYYGAVLVSTVELADPTEGAVGRSPIVARVGSLLFITVPGEAEIETTMTGFDTLNGQWWYNRGPIEFLIAHQNTGSVHTNPYGAISITNTFGTEVGYLDLDPWFVLPQSLRTREMTWDAPFLFGRYTATAAVKRGYNDETDTLSTVFWVVPWQFLAVLFAICTLLILIVRFITSRFEFKRKA